MLKRNELSDPESCLNKAKDDDMIFVLIEGDPDAAETIRFWAAKRLLRGKNKLEDTKIQNALDIADVMEEKV